MWVHISKVVTKENKWPRNLNVISFCYNSRWAHYLSLAFWTSILVVFSRLDCRSVQKFQHISTAQGISSAAELFIVTRSTDNFTFCKSNKSNFSKWRQMDRDWFQVLSVKKLSGEFLWSWRRWLLKNILSFINANKHM